MDRSETLALNCTNGYVVRLGKTYRATYIDVVYMLNEEKY